MTKPIEKIVKDIERESPDVSDHVVGPGGPEVKRVKGKPEKGKTDKFGRYFDLDIHLVNKDKSPRINKQDGFITIKPGVWNRKVVESPKSEVARPEKEAPVPDIKPDLEQKAVMTPEIAGKWAADHTFLIGFMIGGEDFKPIVDQEKGINEPEFMSMAYASYFKAHGIIDIPPGWMLIIALSSYVVPRLTMQRTQTRIKRAATWIKDKAKGVFRRGARPNIGHDGERQDDAGQGPDAIS